MTRRFFTGYFIIGGAIVIISALCNLINLVNVYDSYVQNASSDVVSAFDG